MNPEDMTTDTDNMIKYLLYTKAGMDLHKRAYKEGFHHGWESHSFITPKTKPADVLNVRAAMVAGWLSAKSSAGERIGRAQVKAVAAYVSGTSDTQPWTFHEWKTEGDRWQQS